MFEIHREKIEWAGRELSFETGKIARQADGAVVVKYGDTMILATAVGAKTVAPGQDFFPLSVHYQEKSYAAGKIPGGFFKREARPSEHATLVSRLIDRPIRPLFVKGFMNEVQVMCTTLSHDFVNMPDIVAMVAASAALTISGMPFMGPIGGARVGRVDGEFVLNPTPEEMEKSDLELIVAGTKEGVLMVESQANELPEDVMLDAVMFGWRGFQPVIDAIIKLAEKAAKEPWDIEDNLSVKEELIAKVKDKFVAEFEEAYSLTVKQERQAKLAEVRAKVIEEFAVEGEIEEATIEGVCKSVESDIVRSSILKTGSRIDGRDTKTVRPILAEAGVLPRAHGSALFTRGETQALVVATLGTGQDEQVIDALEGEYKESFLLHYNFPPYSVGECGRIGAVGRREIGHGKLAWRAVKPLLPSKDEFPYTIRIVSEITESNGSSSMATVCGTSLALMDAGVPLKRPIAGIAMGLIKEGDDCAVLTDILGDEDHLGDMDFKVAGTERGVTSLQMDIKITSITEEIMKVALSQANEGRVHILGEMSKALTGAREELSDFAPQMTSFTIPKDKIRDVIGSGGSVIREIVETTGAKVDIDDDGAVCVSSIDAESGKKAVDWIKDIVAVAEVGKIYNGKVARIVDFGAFVNIFGNTDGLVHISEIANKRIGKVSDVLEEGQEVKVKCIGIDNRGRIKLSMRVVDQETGEEIPRDNGDDAKKAADA